MRFTREQAEARALQRPHGYLEELLSASTEIAPGVYELVGEPMTRLMAKYAPYRKGAGSVVKQVIHAGLDSLPLTDQARQRIKGCGGCAARESWLNQKIPDVRHPLRPVP